MEVLLLILDGKRYAIPSAWIDEVVPRTRFAPIDGAAPWVAGLMDHRGTLVPVIDGSQMLHAKQSPPLLGSRIIVMDVPIAREGGGTASARFGLLCDLVTERATIDLADGAWTPSLDETHASIVGAVGRVGTLPIALIDPTRIVRQERLLAQGSAAPTLPPQTAGSVPARVVESSESR